MWWFAAVCCGAVVKCTDFRIATPAKSGVKLETTSHQPMFNPIYKRTCCLSLVVYLLCGSACAVGFRFLGNLIANPKLFMWVGLCGWF